MKKFIALCLVCFFSVQSQADGFLKLAPVVVLNFSNPRVNNPLNQVSTIPNMKFGFGGLAYIPLMPTVYLESGLLYVPDTHTESSVSSRPEVSTQTLMIPLIVRFEPISIISLGVGGYLGFGVGNVTVTTNNVPSDVSYDAYFLSASDYGLVASVALQIPILPLIDILVDGRFLFGLKNRDTTNNATTNRFYGNSNFLVLAGARFGF